LLSQSQSEELARQNLVTLEAIRQGYLNAGVWQKLEQAGLPKAETGVLFGFPIHTSSVAEVDTTVGLVPVVAAPNAIHVAVHGPVDAARVTSFVVRERAGTAVLMDLTAAAAGDLVSGFPRVEARFAAGAVVVTGNAPFAVGHQYGLFMTNDLKNPA